MQVAQTTRVDAALEIGTTTEIVSVNAEAPLLKTANAEQGINVSGDRINALPLNFGGGGGNVGAIRNWLGFVVLAPGVSGTNERASVNGAPGGGFKIYLEGQDVTSSNDTVWTSTVAAASVETIGEFSMQTANFSAEYGQVLGGLFNFTTKSGTNVLRGSAYDYLTNEAMDARAAVHRRAAPQPQAQFRLQRGGPGLPCRASTPGRNKTFFFANVEVFRNRTNSPGARATVPTQAYRNGDFSAALTGRVLGTDPLGRPIMENAIYDPRTSRTVNGQVVRDPFPNNVIPRELFDPVALANPVAHSRAGQFRAAEQLRPGHSEPQESVDPDRQDRPQHREHDEALRVLVGAVHRSDHRARRVSHPHHVPARSENLRLHASRERRQDLEADAPAARRGGFSSFPQPGQLP